MRVAYCHSSVMTYSFSGVSSQFPLFGIRKSRILVRTYTYISANRTNNTYIICIFILQHIQILQSTNSCKKMLKMENVILRHANEHLSIKHSFQKLKNNNLHHLLNHLKSHPPIAPQSIPCSQPQAPNITNKALYLDYVEQVLKNKQLDLIQLERRLCDREAEINEMAFGKGIGAMIGHVEAIKVLEGRMRSMQERMGIRDEEYMMLYRKFQAHCSKSKSQMEEALKKEYTDLANQRRILRTKISQFAQLQSYQKYLNQLHNALQIKSQQLAQRQSFLSQNQSQFYHNQGQQQMQRQQIPFTNPNQEPNPNCQHGQQLQSFYSSGSKKLSENTHTSNRKRIKIFNTKPHCPSELYVNQDNSNNSNSFNGGNRDINNHSTIGHVSTNNNKQSARYYHNETFARDGQYNINQSSAIMAENSKDDISNGYSTNKNQYTSVQPQQKQQIHRQQQPKQKENIYFRQKFSNSHSKKQLQQKQNKAYGRNTTKYHEDSDVSTVQYSVQVDSESFSEAGQRLRKQALIIKYAKKWLKVSFDSNSSKTTLNKKKLMAINLWRMNTCFDQSICESSLNKLNSFQKLWKKQQKLLYSSKMFPYNQLSLKRKKYAQLMFDLQRKIHYRQKTQHLLKSILTNKHRKQRLIFFFYFCKFFRNCSSTTKRSYKQVSRLGHTYGASDIITNECRNDIISSVSSQVLNQQRINIPIKKSTASLSNNNKSPNVCKQQSMQKLSVNHHCKENQHKNIEKQHQAKIKQIIAQKQRTEKLLATQCVRLEGLIKMCVVMSESVFRTSNYAMRKLTQIQYTQKLNTLSSQLNGLQFRYDLVLTKCKLGLANNNNKLSTLQGLLEFTNFLK